MATSDLVVDYKRRCDVLLLMFGNTLCLTDGIAGDLEERLKFCDKLILWKTLYGMYASVLLYFTAESPVSCGEVASLIL